MPLAAERFRIAELDPVIESLSMRETSDIVSLLPHIMLAVIDRIDRGEQVDSIEYVYYLLDGYEEDPFLRKSRRAIRTALEDRERCCVCTWLRELKKRGCGSIASDDLDSCIRYWCAEMAPR
jgi:hypothetical protein